MTYAGYIILGILAIRGIYGFRQDYLKYKGR